MPVNDIIRIADYNSIRLKVAKVMGTNISGTDPDYGYGQTVLSSPVAEGNRVTINEWTNLGYDLTNAYFHITGTAPTLSAVAVGNTLRYNTTNAPVTQWDTIADFIVTNRFTVAGSQSVTQAKGTTSTTWPGVYGTFWSTKIQCTVTANFSSASAARYFFNSGGLIRFSSSRTGGTSLNQNNSWTSLLTSVGTRSFGGNTPGTGLEPNNGLNYYRCSSSFGSWFSQSASAPYGANSFRIQARTPAVLDNSGGTAASIEFLVEWIDNYVDPDTGVSSPGQTTPPGDQVDGTMSLTVTTLEATGVLQPAGAGNFAVESPAITLGAIAP